MTNPLKAFLQANAITAPAFAPDSRYHGLDIAQWTRADGEATDDTASDALNGDHAATASAPQADDVTDPHPESADGAAPRAAAVRA